jgi:hypothetical protein
MTTKGTNQPYAMRLAVSMLSNTKQVALMKFYSVRPLRHGVTKPVTSQNAISGRRILLTVANINI